MSDNMLMVRALNMADIAKGTMPSDEDPTMSTKNQLRVFLIAQAQRELSRVVKLTEMLDKLQDRYIIKAEEYMSHHDDANSSVLYLPSMIDTISKCLETSNRIISQVMGNDKIMNFQIINNDNSTNVTNNIGDGSTRPNTIAIDLEDPASRLKVRETVNSILALIGKQQNSDGEIEDVIDAEVVEVMEDNGDPEITDGEVINPDNTTEVISDNNNNNSDGSEQPNISDKMAMACDKCGKLQPISADKSNTNLCECGGKYTLMNYADAIKLMKSNTSN